MQEEPTDREANWIERTLDGELITAATDATRELPTTGSEVAIELIFLTPKASVKLEERFRFHRLDFG
jgi:hypothetical protein